MKAAFVVQRYGREVVGGSEKLARDYAERLYARGWDITVFTTTALDYTTWSNYFPPGESLLRGVKIKRFPVERERDMENFNAVSREFFTGKPSPQEEEEWLHLQGPVVPRLVEALAREKDEYDIFVFFTYLYYPTYFGLQQVGDRAVLFPTAHDEAPFYMGIMERVFSLPRALLFLSHEEKDLVEKTYPGDNLRQVIGAGISPPARTFPNLFLSRFPMFQPVFLYMGRIDEGKGCGGMLQCFGPYSQYRPSSFALAGRLNMELPPDPRIIYLGFLPEQAKWDAIAASTLTVHPSSLESFSYFLLESMALGKPALVNEASPVLRGHVERSGAGLTYRDCLSFASAAELLLTHGDLYREMAIAGKNYIEENFRWEKILEKFENALLNL